ncbi:hypothetical protein PsYK624_113030 [Phanerochaete sordida]|uniref:Uncharacterized protein n=1 Tax=Phanerochaete sordida TaxID=48140 RepID=A0A9P3GGD9_9APHY|nr:hypothetical protein PsYK624_113030 [Phanerochaete sordida]
MQQTLAAALLVRTRELEQRLAHYEAQDQPSAQVPGVDFDPAAVPELPFLSSWQPTPLASTFTLGVFPDDAIPPAASGSDTSSGSDRSSSPGEQRILESLNYALFQDIVPQPNERSGLVCESTYQLRALFLKHQIQFGFYLRESKLNAIRSGDFSGRVIHPALVHAAQLLGSLLWRVHTKTPVTVINEDVEIGAVLNSLGNPPDPITLVIVYGLLAWYNLYLRQVDLGRDYLAKAAQVIVSRNMMVIPPWMNDVLAIEEPDDDVKEYVTVVGQYVYKNKVAHMVLGLPSHLDEEYDQQVKSLTFMQPWLAKHSVVLMRSKSMMLLVEALRLSQLRAAAAAVALPAGRAIEDIPLPAGWYTQYWETLEEVTSHAALLYPQMLQASLCLDPQHALGLKVGLLIVLAAEVELHRLPGTHHSESRQKALCVILDVIGLAKGLKDEDYALLDPVLGLCYTIVANAIRNDRELLIGVAERQEVDPNEQEAFNVLINSAQQLSTKLPYVEYSLQALCEMASTSAAMLH